MELSRGYFEGHAELAHGVYDVPDRPTAIKGLMYYLEPKYTFTRGSSSRGGTSGTTIRVTPTSLLKMSVRGDHWAPNANPNAPHDNGYAVALQWSQKLDFVEMLQRRQ